MANRPVPFPKYANEKRLLHGGDYNPDQWLKYPHILADDLRFMQQVNANTFSVGIFGWAALEPAEGVFAFEWLDRVMDGIASIGGNVILATPSAARPAWLSLRYPEVNRTNHRRQKMMHGGRHNHCFSSPVYREKVGIINRKLAERYKDHPALFMWHVSNEYSGECHCAYCRENFRKWLRKKYVTIDALNDAWWAAFWSHLYNGFDQVESPSDIGEGWIHGLNLDWKRFVTYQTIDFYRHEIAPVREITPDIAVTNNFMGDFPAPSPFTGLDYAPFAREIDVISWDAYPPWHNDYETTAHLGSKLGFINDYFRTLKDAPFLILESTPSQVNWQPVNRAKRPGMHVLSTVASLAHGADAVMYFQWRKSRGSTEKLHGAVVDHDNSPENRVFKDVERVGRLFENVSEIRHSRTRSQVAVMFDVENLWALDNAEGFSRGSKQYPETVHAHYKAFWDANVSVDVITPDKCGDLSRYKAVVAPMQYMMGEGMMDSLRRFVENGGVLVSTYITGLVDENDLMHLGGFHRKLRELFGVEVRETDTLYPSQRNGIDIDVGELYPDGMQIEPGITIFEAFDYCTVLDVCGAQVLGTYTGDFYAGGAAVTRNGYGKGKAYFIGARTGADFLRVFYDGVMIRGGGLAVPPFAQTPPGVSVQTRTGDGVDYYFVMNFAEEGRDIELLHDMRDLITGREVGKGKQALPAYGVYILKTL
jgi:beta-galactosidase